MIKKLVGLFLVCSTTASAQFVVQDDEKYIFSHIESVVDVSELKVGDVVYADKLDLCIDSTNHLYLTNPLLSPRQVDTNKFKLKVIEEGSISVESIKEQNQLMVNGPVVNVLNQLAQSSQDTALGCGAEEGSNSVRLPHLKVDNLFGYTSYAGLIMGAIKNLSDNHSGSFVYSVETK